MVSSLSVADRAKAFQFGSTAALSPTTKPALTQTRAKPEPQSEPYLSTQPSLSRPWSSVVLPCDASASSTKPAPFSPRHRVSDSQAVIKHARRISISTPLHRRARSDVSVIDPFVSQEPTCNVNSVASPPTIRTSSFAEIELLTAELDATRRRTKSLAHPVRRARASSVLMHSITEEKAQLRLCPSQETIRPLTATSKPTLAHQQPHSSFQVSPCLSEDGSIDWHHFVSNNYGKHRSFDLYNPISITDLAFPISTRKHVYESKLCQPDSPTLNDAATWLEEELANCSSEEEDDDDDEKRCPYRRPSMSMDEEDEYMTPDGSPLLSPVDQIMLPPPQVEITGLGIHNTSLQLPGNDAIINANEHKSADSLLEQVAMHEACVATLNTLSHDRAAAAAAAAFAAKNRQLGQPAPSLAPPRRRSSLVVAACAAEFRSLRSAGSNGDFSATQSDISQLFGDDSYDCSVSPMADMGHGTADYNLELNGERRASAASYLSNDSTVSTDLSIGSHASSLLFNAHLAAPGLQRCASSTNTIGSTRRSSVASSYCSHQLEKAPAKPPRSPLRMHSISLPVVAQQERQAAPPAQGADATRQPSDVTRLKSTPLPPLPAEAVAATHKPRSSKESVRRRRRKEGGQRPQPPARLDSLDASVAAAPKELQLKEEFPQRLLGDWMTTANVSSVVADPRMQSEVRVEPVPLHSRVHNKDGSMFLPGLGEIVPPSPSPSSELAVNVVVAKDEEIPVYPAARKRLGIESDVPTMLSATAAFVANSAAVKSSATLKSKLSGRFGRSPSNSSKDDTCSTGSGSGSGSDSTKVERKTSESSLPLLGKIRKTSTTARHSIVPPEMPSAWKERIVSKRPSLDLRRPSLTSLTSTSTQSSTSSQRDARSRTTLLPAQPQRSRSSMGFRKMLSSITGVEPEREPIITAASDMTLEALAASTFQSPSRAPSNAHHQQERKLESFIHLSDDDSDDADSDSVSSIPSPLQAKLNARRKDLTKLFGTTPADVYPQLTESR